MHIEGGFFAIWRCLGRFAQHTCHPVDFGLVLLVLQVEDNAAELAALGLPVGFGKPTVSSRTQRSFGRLRLSQFAEDPALVHNMTAHAF